MPISEVPMLISVIWNTLFATVRPESPAPTIMKSKALPVADVASSVTTVAVARPPARSMPIQGAVVEARMARTKAEVFCS